MQAIFASAGRSGGCDSRRRALARAGRVVDHEVDRCARRSHRGRAGEPSAILLMRSAAMPAPSSSACGTGRRHQREALRPHIAAQHVDGVGLLLVCDRNEGPRGRIAVGHAQARGDEPLAQRAGKRLVDAEHLAGRFHLRAEDRLDAAHLAERKHRDFDDDEGRVGLQPRPVRQVAQTFAERHTGRRGHRD